MSPYRGAAPELEPPPREPMDPYVRGALYVTIWFGLLAAIFSAFSDWPRVATMVGAWLGQMLCIRIAKSVRGDT